MHLEKDSFLSKAVELRVAIKKAGGYELVEDSHDKRRENCEEDIVERQSPGLVDDLAREGILEGILLRISQYEGPMSRHVELTQNCVMYKAMFL